jgi:GT2 family glycosyltransferase
MGAVGTIARRSVIDDIRGFDEEMDRVDDIDLGWRIWISGNRIISLPESICYHVTLKSWDIRKKTVTHLQQEMALGRALRMMLKNYELKNIFKYLPQALLALLTRAMLNLVRGNSNSLIGFFHILAWCIKTVPSTMRERAYIQKKRKFSDERVFQGIMIKDTLANVYQKYHVEAMQKLENFALSK